MIEIDGCNKQVFSCLAVLQARNKSDKRGWGCCGAEEGKGGTRWDRVMEEHTGGRWLQLPGAMLGASLKG